MPYRPIPDPARDVAVPVWRALRAASEPCSVRDLQRATGSRPDSVRLRLHYWLKAGLVSRVAEKPARYRLVSAEQGPPAMSRNAILRRGPSQRQRMWIAMRVLKRFDLPTLMIAAEATRRAAATYINSLLRGGYLRSALRGNATLGTWSIYVLMKRSGPVAPIVSHSAQAGVFVVDRNDGSRINISPANTRKSSRAPVDGGVG